MKSVFMNLIIILVANMCCCSLLQAELSSGENKELQALQEKVDKNVRMTEEEMVRWEQLVLKDPENLKKLRQQSIDAWKNSLRSEGMTFDDTDVNRNSEKKWLEFMKKKDSSLARLDEENTVMLLRKISQACECYRQENQKYPINLNSVLVNNPDIIDKGLFEKISSSYSFKYETLNNKYKVLALPRKGKTPAVKAFLLDQGRIFFTLDGSVPTIKNNKIL